MTGACVIPIGEEQFQAEVVNHPGAVLVDFHTPQCPPCRMMAPVLEELCSERRSTLKVVKVDAQEYPNLAVEHQVGAVPTFVLYFDGAPIAQTRGYRPKNQFEEWLDSELERVA